MPNLVLKLGEVHLNWPYNYSGLLLHQRGVDSVRWSLCAPVTLLTGICVGMHPHDLLEAQKISCVWLPSLKGLLSLPLIKGGRDLSCFLLTACWLLHVLAVERGWQQTAGRQPGKNVRVKYGLQTEVKNQYKKCDTNCCIWSIKVWYVR